MKAFFLILFLFTQGLFYAQMAEFVVLDATTQSPISNVEAFYESLSKGTISNEEGKLKISIEKDTLTINHIGYETKKILPESLLSINTIYLTPQTIMLDEVVVCDFDLKKKVGYVLDNYFKLYDTDAKILECTYREKFVRNDTLTRLYQVQLDWWSKVYRFSFKEKLDKLLQIHLRSTDYSKILSEDVVPARSIHLEREPMFMYFFLNTYLSLIKDFSKNIEIKKIEKYEEDTKVTFNADIIINNIPQLQLTNSVIYFDNVTQAVKKVIFNDTGQTITEKFSKKREIPYKSITDNYYLEIAFTNYKKRLLFSSFYVKFAGAVEYKDQRDKLFIEYNLLRTGVQHKHINKKHRIDISKSLHEYVVPHKPNETKFLLTTEELNFINQ